MAKNSPEFTISAEITERQTTFRIEPALGAKARRAYKSTMREVVEQGLPEWCEEPLSMVSERRGISRRKIRTTIDFANSTHFGSFREIYGGNGLRILRDMLEDDGATVILDGTAQELADGKPDQRVVPEATVPEVE